MEINHTLWSAYCSLHYVNNTNPHRFGPKINIHFGSTLMLLRGVIPPGHLWTRGWGARPLKGRWEWWFLDTSGIWGINTLTLNNTDRGQRLYVAVLGYDIELEMKWKNGEERCLRQPPLWHIIHLVLTCNAAVFFFLHFSFSCNGKSLHRELEVWISKNGVRMDEMSAFVTRRTLATFSKNQILFEFHKHLN